MGQALIYSVTAKPEPKMLLTTWDNMTDEWIVQNHIKGFFRDPQHAQDELELLEMEYSHRRMS